MNKKYNIEKVKNICNEIGCELISTEYINIKSNLSLKCPNCGNIYKRTLDNLLRRKNPICNSCAMRLANQIKMPIYQEVRKTIEIDGNKLISDTYLNCDSKLLIQCSCGNIFERSYYHYINSNRNCGCDKQSNGSRLIEFILKENNIEYEKEYMFPDLKPLRFDFAIFKNKQLYCLIEYDGWFHFYNHSKWDQLERQQNCDKRKNQYCKDNNIPLIRIDYRNNNTEEIINNLIQNIV